MHEMCNVLGKDSKERRNNKEVKEMVKKVNSVAVAPLATLEKQAVIKTGTGSNPFGFSVFDKVEISTDAKSASQAAQSKSQMKSESSQSSNLFANVFLTNVNAYGIKGAYDLAWAAMRSEFSINSDFSAYTSEKQENVSIDISAYY